MADRPQQGGRVALLLQLLDALAAIAAHASPSQQPISWGERFVMAAAGTAALPQVSLLKRDSLGRWLIDVGEQAQSGIQLAEPLQLLSSFQPAVPHHAAHQHAVLLFHPGLVIGFVGP